MDGLQLSLSLSLSRFPRSQRGFTLVELSIVLVVVGLLIGGILAAQSMIESARMRGVIREMTAIEIDLHRFKEAYKYFPGDLLNASAYGFPSSAATNGDGLIGSGELHTVWNQMNLGIGTKYSVSACNNYAHACGTTFYYKTGVNMPPSVAWPKLGYSFYWGAVSGYGAGLLLGADAPTTGPAAPRGAMTPENAIGLDKKIDNGNLSTGRLVLPGGGYPVYNPSTGQHGSLGCGWVVGSGCLDTLQWGIYGDNPSPPGT